MNTVTIGTTLAIAITCMVIGFVVGGFIGITNRNKRKNKSEETSELSPSGDQSPAPLADPAKYTELLRLWRAKDSNGLFVETSGHLLGSSEPLNAAQKNRFVDLIKELAGWLNISSDKFIDIKPETSKSSVEPVNSETVQPIKSVSTEDSEAVVQPHVVKASVPVKTDPLPSALPLPPIPAAPDASVEIQSAVPPAVEIPRVLPQIKPPAEPVKKPAGTMVEQIDDILQEIIHFSDNPSRMIRLVEERQNGVVVWVGQEHYIGIDAVTDQSAKELIRAAVKEWDRRTENRT
jgi:hypothetical protein